MSAPARQRHVVAEVDLRALHDDELVALLVRRLGIRRARRVAGMLKPPTPKRPRAPKPVVERIAFVRQQVDSLAADVGHDDPEELAALVDLLDVVDAAVGAAARQQARVHGWPTVGAALGLSRQGARQKYEVRRG